MKGYVSNIHCKMLSLNVLDCFLGFFPQSSCSIVFFDTISASTVQSEKHQNHTLFVLLANIYYWIAHILHTDTQWP